MAKPERCLHLSYPASDEAGGEAPAARSWTRSAISSTRPRRRPRATTRSRRELIERATLADFVPAPEDASAPHDLARALAAVAGDAGARATALELPDGAAERALTAVADARERVEAAREPGPLSDPAVLAELSERDLFGASTLEEFVGCSYRWFVNHELRPQRIEPDAEALESGGIVHETLERLFREPPAGERRPAEESCGRWVARARELLREVAAERGWNLDTAAAAISLARLDAVVERYIRRDAATGGPLMPDPDLLEARFGDGPEDRFEPADFGTLPPARRASTGSTSTAGGP